MFENVNSTMIMETAIEFAGMVILAIVTLIIGFWIAGQITKFVRKRMERREVDATVIPFITNITKIGLRILVLISVAGIFGIQTTSFVAVLGAAAFAIGLALQGTLGHFASGVLLLVFKPFKVGDAVEIQGVGGSVNEISIFHTVIHTFDGTKVVIPNGVVTSGTIQNITTLGTLRAEWTIGIDYSDDIDKARSIIRSILENNEKVIKERPIDCFVSELADSSVNFKVRCWTTADDKWPVYFDFIEQVKKAFDKEGVSFPFPQIDLHVDKPE